MENRFFGTDEQKRMQAKSDALVPWIQKTPGACITGRVTACDDFSMLDRNIIQEHLKEDGMFAFRFVSADGLEEIRSIFSTDETTIQVWKGFQGSPETILESTVSSLATQLPNALRVVELTGTHLCDMQEFLSEQGIAPISTASLSGKLFPAISMGIMTPENRLVATGFSALTQNQFSPWKDCAWAGLLAVAPDFRGLGLGKRINAEVLRSSIIKLGANSATELAASDNAASIGMIKSCGLDQTERYSVVVMRGGKRSFTR